MDFDSIESAIDNAERRMSFISSNEIKQMTSYERDSTAQNLRDMYSSLSNLHYILSQSSNSYASILLGRINNVQIKIKSLVNEIVYYKSPIDIEAEKKAEAQRKIIAEQKELEAQQRAAEKMEWERQGLCTSCGGAINGLFVSRCIKCKSEYGSTSISKLLGSILIFTITLAGALAFTNIGMADILRQMGLWQVEFIPNTIPLQHYVVGMIAINEGNTMFQIFLNFFVSIIKPYLLLIVCCAVTYAICRALRLEIRNLVHYAYILIGFGITLWFVINPIINPDVFGYRFTTPNPYFVDDFNIMSRSILWRMAFVMAPLAAFIITKDLISTINYGDPFDKISISLIGSAIYVISVIFSVSNYHGNLNQFPIFFFLVLSIVIGLCIIIISQIVSNIMASLTAFLR